MPPLPEKTQEKMVWRGQKVVSEVGWYLVSGLYLGITEWQCFIKSEFIPQSQVVYMKSLRQQGEVRAMEEEKGVSSNRRMAAQLHLLVARGGRGGPRAARSFAKKI